MTAHDIYELLFKYSLIKTREHELSGEQHHAIDCFLRDVRKQMGEGEYSEQIRSLVRKNEGLHARIYDLEEEIDILETKLSRVKEDSKK